MFRHAPRQRPLASWLLVLLGVVVILATVPLARSVVNLMDRHLGRQAFTYLLMAALGLGLAWSCLYLRRLRPFPLKQGAWLVGVAALYAYFTLKLRKTPEEAVHFLEYGALSLLAYRALTHHVRDWTIYLSAAAVALMAGVLDEVIQWLTPARYFDFRDIGLNFLGALLMQVALARGIRPPLIRESLKPGSVALACSLVAAAVLLLGLCASNTPRHTAWLAEKFTFLSYLKRQNDVMGEYGYRHYHPEVGYFYSRFTKEDLKELDRTRGLEFAAILDRHRHTPYGRFLREYNAITAPFLHEARVHIFIRNRWFYQARREKNPPERTRKLTCAYREQRLLETFFGNTVNNSSYRWPPRRLKWLGQQIDPDYLYHSRAGSHLITRFSEGQLWAGIGVFILLLAGINAWVWRRHTPARKTCGKKGAQ